MSDLEKRLLAAHAADDRRLLVTLYQEAAMAADTVDAAGFFLTHAYVYALETAHPAVGDLRAQLIAMGREQAAG